MGFFHNSAFCILLSALCILDLSLGFPIYNTSAVIVKVDDNGKIIPVDVVDDLDETINRNVIGNVNRQNSLFITTVSNEILKISNVNYNKR